MKICTILFLAASYLCLLCGCDRQSISESCCGSATSSSWGFDSFEKVDSLNPILTPSALLAFVDPLTGSTALWEERNVLNPTAVVRNDTVFLLYRAQDSSGTSRIGLAVSTDGLHFDKLPSPVLGPKEDFMKRYEWNYLKIEGNDRGVDCKNCLFDGVEDPRIIETEEGRYFMTYTAYDGKTARLSLASSMDLHQWTKHGLVLSDDKYEDLWSKAGAIVGSLRGNSIVAERIDGKYWMYFGDTDLFMASSEDMIHWEVAVDEESGEPISVLHPRRGMFDSRLVEPGPYALLQDEGIVLMYNASNAKSYGDPELPTYTYAAGQALFDPKMPYRLLDRKQEYFIHPDKPYEREGEVNEVCFVEGLVYFKDMWFLYYGTADSKIAVAVQDKKM